MKEDSRYIFAVGRIRALEARLLGSDLLTRLVGSDTDEEAFRVLSETDYKTLRQKSLDEFFYEASEDTVNLLKGLSLDEPLTCILSSRQGFASARVALKSALAGDKMEPKGVRENNTGLSREVADAAKRAEAVFSKSGSWREVDIIFEKEWLRCIHLELKKLGSDFLEELLLRFVDLTNIKSFFRLKVMSAEKVSLANALLDYGSLEKALFISSYEEAVDVFPGKVAHTSYGELVREGEGYLRENNSLARLERRASEHILGFLKKSRYVVSGCEPIIAYLIFKENELRSLRTILTGKQAGIGKDFIKEMIPR